MQIIVYYSKYKGSEENIDQVLDSIEASSKKNNQKHNITGVLFYHNKHFLQILEGEKQNLDGLMQIIHQDDRHHDIHLLIDSKISRRDFDHWNMDCFNLSDDRDLNVEELKKIRDIYLESFKPSSDMLLDFYKAMLSAENHNYY